MYKKLISDKLDDNINEIGREGFQDRVLESENPVLLEFTADWCRPCLDMSEITSSLSEQYDGDVDFLRVDVDKNRQLSKELNVELLPTLIFFKEGKTMAVMVGNNSKDKVNFQLKKLLSD